MTTYSGPVPDKRELITEPRFSDKVFRAVVTSGGFTSLLILGLIAIFLTLQSSTVFKQFGFHFLTGFEWSPGDPESGAPAKFGIGAMLIGTLVVSLIGLLIALPISVGKIGRAHV